MHLSFFHRSIILLLLIPICSLYMHDKWADIERKPVNAIVIKHVLVCPVLLLVMGKRWDRQYMLAFFKLNRKVPVSGHQNGIDIPCTAVSYTNKIGRSISMGITAL